MKLSPKKHSRLAAAFAISNMGQKVPDDIAKHPESWCPTSRCAIDCLAGHLMETNEHETIFAGEAEYWEKYLAKESEEDILRIHGPFCPWIQEILDVPEEALV